MTSPHKILVYEHITGGGLAGRELPPGLAAEGGRMLEALLADLRAAGTEPSTLRDARLAPLPGVATLAVNGAADRPILWRRALEAADAVWPIAPETDGALERLSRDILDHGRRLLGSHPDTVTLCASKQATDTRLTEAGIPTVPGWPADREPTAPPPWVVKPDDGAGCENTRRLADHGARRRWLAEVDDPARYYMQPCWPGQAASLSLLCHGGHAELLACNRQRMVRDGDIYNLDDCEPNALAERAGEWGPLAAAVAAAIPGLWGYAGVDLLYEGKETRVLEVNPRLTLSYCGLGAALGINPAARVLGLP
jgi:predicted ATP-grasp superfamily ATP-dependent carboligase